MNIYVTKDRPDAQYKKNSAGSYDISLDAGKTFTPIKDADGTRTKYLDRTLSIKPGTQAPKSLLYDAKDVEKLQKIAAQNQSVTGSFNCTGGACNFNRDYIAKGVYKPDIRTLLYKADSNIQQSKNSVPSGSILGTKLENNSSIDAWEVLNVAKSRPDVAKVMYENINNTQAGVPKGFNAKSIPVGSVVLYGNSKGAYTNTDAPRHATTVIGYDKKDGMPLIYDYGEVKRLDGYTKHNITGIVSFNAYKDVNLKNQYKSYEKNAKELNYNAKTGTKKVQIKNAAAKTVYNAINPYQKKSLGVEYNIPKSATDKLHRALVGIGSNETNLEDMGTKKLSAGTKTKMAADNFVGNYAVKPVAKILDFFGQVLAAPYKQYVQGREPSHMQDWQIEVMALKQAKGDKVKAKKIFNTYKQTHYKSPHMSELSPSVGAFAIKNLNEDVTSKHFGITGKSMLYGPTVNAETELKRGARAAYVHLLDSYKTIRRQYPALKEDDLVNLAIVAYNNKSKSVSPEFIKTYIQGNVKDDYLYKVHHYTNQYIKEEKPKLQKKKK